MEMLSIANRPAVTLSAEQQMAFADILAGNNVLITGQAGTGKSTLLAQLAARHGKNLSITASTGIAALNVKGTTLHTFAGLYPFDAPAAAIAARIIQRKQRTFHNIVNCRILAIDEISMISADLFEKADQVFRIVRGKDIPFGGVQIVGFGDFLQLPPIGGGNDSGDFAFLSDAWEEAEISTHMLNRVFRQADQAFADALGHLRLGEINHPSISLIAARNNIPLPDDGVAPVMIDTHNANVDRLNQIEMDKLTTDEFLYYSIDTGKSDQKEKLDRDCRAPKELRLKVGAQVMLLVNLDLEQGLANGSLGKVESLERNNVRVRFGKLLVELERHPWEIKDGEVVLATREQYPLRLAWAVTAHKSQGMTLDRIVCSMSKSFDYGQAYVALSRVRTIEGLFLKNCSRHIFKAHPDALEFYRRPTRIRVRPGELALG